MVILHYIPSLQKSMGQTAAFAQMLRNVMGKTIETHYISGAVSRSEFVRRLGAVNPDIVHIHGCWSMRIALAEKWAINRGYPVILSPHGGMSPENIHTNFWKKRLPQIIFYQFRTIRNAFVLHASSAEELKHLKELGWKKRIALIPYPTSEEDNQMLCDSFRDLYQKVLDTKHRNILHIREREALWLMLNASIAPNHHLDISEEEHHHLLQLTAHNWQSIMVYAIDHRISEQLIEGAETLGINIPVSTTQLPPRYTVKPAFHSGDITRKERKNSQQFSSTPTELGIATDLYILYRSLYNNEVREGYVSPISILCKIAREIRWTDYEEDILQKILKAYNIEDFSSRVMQILEETIRLTIGFMPIDPIDDKTTETIRKKLNNLI